MSNPSQPSGGLTALGKAISFILVLGLIGLGAWIVMKHKSPATSSTTNSTQTDNTANAALPKANFDTKELVDTKTQVPTLDPPQTYIPKNNTIDLELSVYPGYAGFIAANGGLAPNDQSYFTTKYGFKLNITLTEEESTNRINSGKIAASATTADVPALYGRQYNVVVPAQISYSRGADGIVVSKDIKKINDLKGRTVSAAQFTESDFFIRYLAHESGLAVKTLPDLATKPDPDSINVVYCSDGLAAGELFSKALAANSPLLAGCVTWAPATTTIPQKSDGNAKLLVSTKNLLIIADILIVNRGFAEKNPDMVAGLVDGLLAGNRMVTENPAQYADVIAKAFSTKDDVWDAKRAVAELTKVHLSNLPEQLAFFTAGITNGGSFPSVYQSSYLSYGDEFIPNLVDSDHFLSIDALKKIEAAGTYKTEVASLQPISGGLARPTEVDPVLSKNINFYFEPNDSKLDLTTPVNKKTNITNLEAIKRILDVAPGSYVILVGHVDDARVADIRRNTPQDYDSIALQAMQLSRDRADEVRTQLIALEKVDKGRLEIVGKGWTQPISHENHDLNRRVEVQWFTLE